MSRYIAQQAGKRWVVVDTHSQNLFVESVRSETIARRRAREWSEFNGPPVPALAELLVIDPKRRRR